MTTSKLPWLVAGAAGLVVVYYLTRSRTNPATGAGETPSDAPTTPGGALDGAISGVKGLATAVAELRDLFGGGKSEEGTNDPSRRPLSAGELVADDAALPIGGRPKTRNSLRAPGAFTPDATQTWSELASVGIYLS